MSGDPITSILDTVNVWKAEGSKVLNKTINTVKDSNAYEYVEGVVKGGGKNLKMVARQQPPPPPSLWEKTTDWVRNNKWLVGILAAGATGGTVYYFYYYAPFNKPHKSSRRRAKKAPNGARKEVVLIAGSPSEGITRIIADDLNKRGFIIYLTTSSAEEESMVLKENSPDIRPLPIQQNGEASSSIQEASKKLTDILNTPVKVFDDEPAHKLSLTGVLVIPDLYFPAGPVESIRADTWSDLMYSKVLGPLFLLSNGLLDVVRAQNSRIVLLTPSIMNSLKPGFHAAECMASSALSSLALCLHRELKPQGIPFVHLKLGSFDVRHGRQNPSSQERQINSAIRADVLSWNERLKGLYAQAYKASAHLQTNRASGSNIRVLNHAVFDSLTTKNPKRIWYVGRGSYAYQWLSNFVPEGAMTWLLQPQVSVRDSENDWETV